MLAAKLSINTARGGALHPCSRRVNREWRRLSAARRLSGPTRLRCHSTNKYWMRQSAPCKSSHGSNSRGRVRAHAPPLGRCGPARGCWAGDAPCGSARPWPSERPARECSPGRRHRRSWLTASAGACHGGERGAAVERRPCPRRGIEAQRVGTGGLATQTGGVTLGAKQAEGRATAFGGDARVCAWGAGGERVRAA